MPQRLGREVHEGAHARGELVEQIKDETDKFAKLVKDAKVTIE